MLTVSSHGENPSVKYNKTIFPSKFQLSFKDETFLFIIFFFAWIFISTVYKVEINWTGFAFWSKIRQLFAFYWFRNLLGQTKLFSVSFFPMKLAFIAWYLRFLVEIFNLDINSDYFSFFFFTLSFYFLALSFIAYHVISVFSFFVNSSIDSLSIQ